MSKRVNHSELIGKTFGYLTVLSLCNRPENVKCEHQYYKVRCVCGKEFPRRKDLLFFSKKPCCGCQNRRALIERQKVHGLRSHELYNVWASMIKRCHVASSISYKYYGAKGISVCERWRSSFKSFLEDVGERPKGYQLDRIDNYKGYSKENCRWVTVKENLKNKRKNQNERLSL